MTRQLDSDRLLENWLADGPSRMPDRIVDSIVDQLDTNKQRKPFWLLGRGKMNNRYFAIGGLAAALVLAVAGAGYFFGPMGGFAGKPSPSSSPTPSPTPTSTQLHAGDLAPGTYSFDMDGHRYTFSVAAPGWVADLTGTDAGLSVGGHDDSPPDFAALFFWAPAPNEDPPQDGVWTEACQWTGTYSQAGTTATDLANALADLSGFETTQPTDVTFGQYSGKRVQLTVPLNAVSFGLCADGEYRSFNGRYYQVNGQVDDIRIADLENGRRQLIHATYDPGASAAARAQLEAIFDSMVITPLTP